MKALNTLLIAGLLSIMGNDCKLVAIKKGYYMPSGLKQALFYCQNKDMYVSTLTCKKNTKEWAKHPLFYMLNYDYKENKASETWIDRKMDGLNGNEELYWTRKKTKNGDKK